MNLENGTSDPVDYDQSGGGTPQEEEFADNKTGSLDASGENGDKTSFPPAGKKPWIVTFTNANSKTQQATSDPTTDANATVTLNADWTVTVSTN